MTEYNDWLQEAATEWPPEPQMDPRVEQTVAWAEEQQAEAAYDSEMARVVEANPGLDPDLLHPFVAASEGDFYEAVDMYANWVNQFGQSEPGFDEAPDAEAPEAAPEPVNNGRQSPLGNAIDAFLTEQRG